MQMKNWLKNKTALIITAVVIIGSGIAGVLLYVLPASADSVNLYAVVGQCDAVSGTAAVTGSPARYTTAGGTITVTTSTTNQTFTVTCATGTSATVTSGTATISGSPKVCTAGAATTVTVTNTITAGTCTIAVTYASAGTFTGTYSWSTSSGGVPYAGSHAAPTASNPVVFDAKSFGGASEAFNVNAASVCAAMTWSGATNTPAFTGSTYTLTVSGGVTFISGMTFSGWTTGTITFASVAGTNYLDSGGNSSIAVPITVNDAAGTVALNNNNYISSTTFTLTAGTFNLNGLTLTTTGTFASAAAGILTIGSSTLNCGVWTAAAGETLSMSGGTINVTAASGTFATGSLATYGTVNFQGAAATITGSGTFVNLNLVDPNATQTIQFTAGTTQTVSGTLTATGYSTSARCIFKSTSASTATISAAAVAVTKSTISYITGSGAGNWNLSASANDVLQATVNSCTGITFGLYWIGHSATWVIASFADVSGTAANAIVLPDKNTNVYFDVNSFNGASQTVTMAAATTKNIDWTGASGTPTMAGSTALAVWGNLTFIAGMLNTYTGTITFSSTSSQTITTPNTLGSDPMTFNGVGGSWTLQNTLNIGSGTITVTNGTLQTNGQTVTTTGTFTTGAAGIVNITNSTITCGTWTANASETLTSTGSTITVTGATTFGGAGLTYNTVNLNGAGTVTISGSNTFTNLNLPSGTTQTVKFTDSTTQYITVVNFSGSNGHVHTLQGTSTVGWAIYYQGVGSVTVSYCSIIHSNITSSGAWTYDYTCTYSGDSGWIGLPDYWVGGTGTWDNSSKTHWASSSNGTGGTGCIPGSGNQVIFDNNSFTAGSQSVTINAAVSVRSMNWAAVTHTPTLKDPAGTHSITVYGDIIFGNMLIEQDGSALIEQGTGTYNFVTNNIVINFYFTQNFGTLNLVGNFSNPYLCNLMNFNCNGYTVNFAWVGISGIFDYSNTTVNCSGWDCWGTIVSTNSSILNLNNVNAYGLLDGVSTNIYNGVVNINSWQNSGALIGVNGTINDLVLNPTVTMTIPFQNNFTTTVNSCSLSGSNGYIHTLTNSSGTSTWNLVYTGVGTVTASYCVISYSNASPANTFYYDNTCTYNGTSGWSSSVTASITNSPSSLDFGTVMPSTTYYANGTTYSNPVTGGQCAFTITNTGSSSCNIALSCTNATGGNTWTLVSSGPTGDQFEVIAVYSGENPTNGLVLTTSNQSFYPNLPASGTLPWDFEEILGGTGSGKSGTFSDSSTKTYTITITAQ